MIPTETPPQAIWQYKDIVKAEALALNLEPAIILAQIWTESSGDPQAKRFESRYQYFYHTTKHSLWDAALTIEQNRNRALANLGAEEFQFQSTSWGLMALAGTVARELGFESTSVELCDPTINIHYGCIAINHRLNRAHGSYRSALIRYEGSPIYADLVLHRANMLETL